MPAPGAPNIVRQPFASQSTLEFAWNPPTNNGGSPITGYRFTLQPGNVVQYANAQDRFKAIAPLSNEILYSAQIDATNDNGVSYGTVTSFRPFQPGTLPTFGPSTVTATTVGDNSAIVAWTAPRVQPTSKIYWYSIYSSSSSGADPILSTTSSALYSSNCIIRNLNSNSIYYFNVYAVNCPGWSPVLSTNTIAFQVVPGFIFGTDFNSGNDIGIIGYNSNLQVSATSTINGIGLAYNTSNQTTDLYMSNLTMVNTNTVSFTASIYPQNVPTNRMVFFANRGYPGNSSGFEYTASGTLGYTWNNESSTWGYNTNVPTIPNVWQHVVLVISPSNAKWYRNGTLCNTYTYTHVPMTFPRWDIGQDSGLVPVIGTRRDMPGFMDNIRVYNKCLTDGEVSTIYQNTTTGIAVPDYIFGTNFNYGNDIGIVGYATTLQVTNTVTGSGYAYNSSNPTSNMYFSNTFMSNTNTVSLTASIYPRNTTTGFANIFASRGFPSPCCAFELTGTGANLGYNWNDNASAYSYDSGVALTLNTWQHVALVISPSNAKWYKNGTLLRTFTNTHTALTFNRWDIGQDSAFVPGRNFPGYIDNIRVYNRCITDGEVSAIYQNTLIV